MASASCLLPELSALEAAIVQSVRALAHAMHPGGADASVDSQPDDITDVEQTRRGDPDAYRRLIGRHQEHVARILWRFSRDRGVHEELVQDVFVEAYLGLNNYRRKAPFEHWLARIATRVGYRYWKEKARRRDAETFDLREWDRAVSDDGIADGMDADHAAALLYDLLAQMPPRDRLVLTLRYLDQCDVAETARRTGWTKTMVKVQTLRARNKLRKLVEQTGGAVARRGGTEAVG